jgi:peptidoglycan hydrolase-like protein with peptidoglycan-binding domain
MKRRTRMLKAFITATIAIAALCTTAGAAGATGPAEPFCDSGRQVPVGNGWSAPVPLAVHRTGRTSPSCYLRYGDRSWAVFTLQHQLSYCYGADLVVTGLFDARTKAALQRAQRLHGITADGIYGPVTLKALKWREVREVEGRRFVVESTKCYRPFASRTITPNPAAGAYSPYCDAPMNRYAGNGWWVWLPAAETRTGSRHFACYLKQGDRSWGVEALQQNLRSCYRASIAVDGYYGPQTKAAVERVQRLHGVRVDGVYGPATMKAMYWRLGKNYHQVTSEKCYSPF